MSKKPDLDCMSEDQLQRLRDKIDQQIIELSELRREIEHRLVDVVYWSYKRHPWGYGWLQSSPRRRKKADGSIKTYGCWSFYWIEEGKRKVEHIGSDERLKEWKGQHPLVSENAPSRQYGE
jgi:hypothetical protein